MSATTTLNDHVQRWRDEIALQTGLTSIGVDFERLSRIYVLQYINGDRRVDFRIPETLALQVYRQGLDDWLVETTVKHYGAARPPQAAGGGDAETEAT